MKRNPNGVSSAARSFPSVPARHHQPSAFIQPPAISSSSFAPFSSAPLKAITSGAVGLPRTNGMNGEGPRRMVIWPPSQMESNGREWEEKTGRMDWTGGTRGRTRRRVAGGPGRAATVHAHTLYLVLCVALVNLIALLCIIHFKLLLVVSTSSDERSFSFRSPTIQNPSATMASLGPEKNADEQTKLEKKEGDTFMGNREMAEKAKKEGRSNEEQDEQMKKMDRMMKKNITTTARRPGRINSEKGPTESTEMMMFWEAELDGISFQVQKEFPEQTESGKMDEGSAKREDMGMTDGYGAGQIDKAASTNDCHTSSAAILSQQMSMGAAKSGQIHFVLDCQNEEDAQGGNKCAEWRKAGYCAQHPATRWLFCRRECLCSDVAK